MIRLFIIIFIIANISKAYAGFIAGVGYFMPEEHRINNEISSLPFGLNILPIIAYRGEQLNIFGTNISYSLFRGPINLSIKGNATGDRYDSEGIIRRKTSITSGISLRLLLISLSIDHDISGHFNSYIGNISISWPFKITDHILLRPSLRREILSKEYANYYYGVSEKEAKESVFSSYRATKSNNTIISGGLNFKLNDVNSFLLSYSHKIFDNKIYKSPTVSKKSYGILSLFWNYSL